MGWYILSFAPDSPFGKGVITKGEPIAYKPVSCFFSTLHRPLLTQSMLKHGTNLTTAAVYYT
jgi:hypothetical protein